MKALYRIETHRIAEPGAEPWGKVDTPAQAAEFMRSRIGSLSREHFLAMYFDSNLEVIGYEIIGVGSNDSTEAYPRDIVGTALRLGCSRIVVGHNHPSGDLTPSGHDLHNTKVLHHCCTMFDINLLDAVIVTADSHRSILSRSTSALDVMANRLHF